MTKAGEASVSGELPEGLSVSGTSDFGAFSLPLAKIKRLEFQQPGTIASPAHLDEFSEVDHHWLTSPGYDAILTLTDGTTMQVSHLRRHAKYHVSGNNVIGIGGSADHDVDFDAIDFRFIQGETSQKIRFDSVKTVEFSSNDSVTITTKSGAQAAMKFSPKDEERLMDLTDGATMAISTFNPDLLNPSRLEKRPNEVKRNHTCQR